MKMLPLYSCIISEHPGVAGAEVLPRRVGGTLLFAGLRIHLLCSCPAHFTANPSVTRGTKLMLTWCPWDHYSDIWGVFSKNTANPCGSKASASSAIQILNALLSCVTLQSALSFPS